MNDPGSGSCGLVDSTARSAAESAIAREQAAALHDEIDRLPNSFRLPVVLCYFEDLTLDEVAHRLQWPAGTVRSRLARARDKVRRALDPPGRRLAGGCTRRGSEASIGFGIRLSGAVRCDNDSRGSLRSRAGRLARGRGPRAGGSQIHAREQTENRPRCPCRSSAPRHGRALLESRARGPGSGPEHRRPCGNRVPRKLRRIRYRPPGA